MGELQDPFLVSVHLIANPGEGGTLQHAADSILACVHPELQLFRVSERASLSQRTRARPHPGADPGSAATAAAQPALAVILFLQEACGGEEEVLMLHRALQRPPWRYHHTEKVSNGRRMLPLAPCSQDFFTLAPGTPLWAVRQVHYGKEIVRLTVYCRHENYGDMVRLYKLLLQRRVSQKKEDFCFFVVYSNPDMEIQLSFKRLPRGQAPAALESAVMEVRVRDVGALVPLLPHPCSPISAVRWQTEDYDGNKILLQVQAPQSKRHRDPSHASTAASAPPTIARNPSHRSRRHHHHRAAAAASHLRDQPSAHAAAPEDAEQRRAGWRSHRSTSVFSLPNLASASFRSTCSSPGPAPGPAHPGGRALHRSNSLAPPFRLNVDALVGAEETDVDTGDRVNPGGGVDLSVVSAYLKSSLPQTSRPLSAPPGDAERPQESPFRAATLGRTPGVFSAAGGCGSSGTRGAPSPSDASLNHSDSCSLVSATIEEVDGFEEEEEDQEFYI